MRFKFSQVAKKTRVPNPATVIDHTDIAGNNYTAVAIRTRSWIYFRGWLNAIINFLVTLKS
jgi:hypothetical protein